MVTNPSSRALRFEDLVPSLPPPKSHYRTSTGYPTDRGVGDDTLARHFPLFASLVKILARYPFPIPTHLDTTPPHCEMNPSPIQETPSNRQEPNGDPCSIPRMLQSLLNDDGTPSTVLPPGGDGNPDTVDGECEFCSPFDERDAEFLQALPTHASQDEEYTEVLVVDEPTEAEERQIRRSLKQLDDQRKGDVLASVYAIYFGGHKLPGKICIDMFNDSKSHIHHIPNFLRHLEEEMEKLKEKDKQDIVTEAGRNYRSLLGKPKDFEQQMMEYMEKEPSIHAGIETTIQMLKTQSHAMIQTLKNLQGKVKPKPKRAQPTRRARGNPLQE